MIEEKTPRTLMGVIEYFKSMAKASERGAHASEESAEKADRAWIAVAYLEELREARSKLNTLQRNLIEADKLADRWRERWRTLSKAVNFSPDQDIHIEVSISQGVNKRWRAASVVSYLVSMEMNTNRESQLSAYAENVANEAVAGFLSDESRGL